MNLQIQRVLHEPRKIDMEWSILRYTLENQLELKGKKKNIQASYKKTKSFRKGRIRLVFSLQHTKKRSKSVFKNSRKRNVNQDLISTCPSNTKAIKISFKNARTQEYNIQETLLRNL